MAHRHGLDLVVGDVDRRDAELALERGDLCAHLDAQLGVEVRQRLVHEEHLRLAHDGPAHGHALPLAAGELLRLAVSSVVEVEQPTGPSTCSSISSLGSWRSASPKPMFSPTVMCG